MDSKIQSIPVVPPMIRFHDVTKQFGTKTAVSHLNLEVRAGELFAFLGPNGAGKTTSIKMICGLLKPTSGTVEIGGHQAGSLQARNCLAYVPDQPFLYDKLTGREFLNFVTQMRGMDKVHSQIKIAEMVQLFEIEGFLDELCEGYSQGMKQRLVFASALVHEPSVLVVDEPFVGLDPRSARIVKQMFVDQASRGVAVLMSIHLLSIAESLADRIGIIHQGKMIATGTLSELRGKESFSGSLEDLFLELTGGDELLQHTIKNSQPSNDRQGN
ncbi:MAG: ABC transporter ATP-binding protein [Planctomycetota bacterium]